LSHSIHRRFERISFHGESRTEKEVIKKKSYIFYQKDPASPIQYLKVENLGVIFSQDPDSTILDSNFILLYGAQGIILNTLEAENKPTSIYYECLKFLNDLENVKHPLIIIPNHNIWRAAWKFDKKQSIIHKIYGENLQIRMSDNLPISKSSTFILPPISNQSHSGYPISAQSAKCEETYFKIYQVMSKINSTTNICLSLEVYKSISCFKNIVELVSGINLTKLTIFIKSYEYDKNQEDHIFLTKLLKSCKTLQNFKFNGYRFNNLNETKLVAAKKLIDQYYVEESLIDYSPLDVWDIGDF